MTYLVTSFWIKIHMGFSNNSDFFFDRAHIFSLFREFLLLCWEIYITDFLLKCNWSIAYNNTNIEFKIAYYCQNVMNTVRNAWEQA